MKEKVVAANWKMNLTNSQTISFINEIKESCDTKEALVIFFVPTINIISAQEAVKGTNIKIGCQNIHYLEKGAYTGEISAEMLTDIGVEYVLVGHSERRLYNNETNETVNLKLIHALSKGLKPILCVGENLEQRELNITHETVSIQVKSALQNISREDVDNIIIAYEPLWAIGTGKTATSEEANEVCMAIRDTIAQVYDVSAAFNLKVLYGGSVTKKNAKEIFDMEAINGGLVGGASLKPDFSEVIFA